MTKEEMDELSELIDRLAESFKQTGIITAELADFIRLNCRQFDFDILREMEDSKRRRYIKRIQCFGTKFGQ